MKTRTSLKSGRLLKVQIGDGGDPRIGDGGDPRIGDGGDPRIGDGGDPRFLLIPIRF